jgi:hypothetical protein
VTKWYVCDVASFPHKGRRCQISGKRRGWAVKLTWYALAATWSWLFTPHCFCGGSTVSSRVLKVSIVYHYNQNRSNTLRAVTHYVRFKSVLNPWKYVSRKLGPNSDIAYLGYIYRIQPDTSPSPIPFCSFAARPQLGCSARAFIHIMMWLLRSVNNLRHGDSRMTEWNRMTEIGSSTYHRNSSTATTDHISRVPNGFGPDVVRNRSNNAFRSSVRMCATFLGFQLLWFIQVFTSNYCIIIK